MTTTLCAIIVHAALVLSGAEATPPAADSYAEARRTTVETGKPMVVMVSTDWCPPCQVMKKTILPRVRKRGLLRKVAFAMVNPDQRQRIGGKDHRRRADPPTGDVPQDGRRLDAQETRRRAER